MGGLAPVPVAEDMFIHRGPKLAVSSQTPLLSGIDVEESACRTRTTYHRPLEVGEDLTTFHLRGGESV